MECKDSEILGFYSSVISAISITVNRLHYSDRQPVRLLIASPYQSVDHTRMSRQEEGWTVYVFEWSALHMRKQ